MKRVNNVYFKNISFTNLLNEYKIVKKNCRSDRKLYDFSKNLNINIIDIEKSLINGDYKFNSNYIFLIKEL